MARSHCSPAEAWTTKATDSRANSRTMDLLRVEAIWKVLVVQAELESVGWVRLGVWVVPSQQSITTHF